MAYSLKRETAVFEIQTRDVLTSPSPSPRQEGLFFRLFFRTHLFQLGSLTNHDGEENGKKAKGLD